MMSINFRRFRELNLMQKVYAKSFCERLQKLITHGMLRVLSGQFTFTNLFCTSFTDTNKLFVYELSELSFRPVSKTYCSDTYLITKDSNAARRADLVRSEPDGRQLCRK